MVQGWEQKWWRMKLWREEERKKREKKETVSHVEGNDRERVSKFSKFTQKVKKEINLTKWKIIQKFKVIKYKENELWKYEKQTILKKTIREKQRKNKVT